MLNPSLLSKPFNIFMLQLKFAIIYIIHYFMIRFSMFVSDSQAFYIEFANLVYCEFLCFLTKYFRVIGLLMHIRDK